MTAHAQESQLALDCFHPVLRQWFIETFPAVTPAQAMAWPAIAAHKNTLLLAPTGSGKTLAAFLVAINRIMFDFPMGVEKTATAARKESFPGVRVLYLSPLKALGVDIQRNLRSPIAGICAVGEREGLAHRVPTVGVRSGDTPPNERYRLSRKPPDILITTPESLYLMLTSRAREILKTVDTIIVDEIHTMVATKRGAHLFVSIERLERLRRWDNAPRPSLQRIGLSATQRPLEEVARLLGGFESDGSDDTGPTPRSVEIIEAGRGKQLDLRIEVPVENMSRLAESQSPAGAADAGPALPSIWPAIHPRLVELIRRHRSTMIFVNSRRLAERLASAINEVAKEQMALAHHGSIAKDRRLLIEDRLKRGQLPAIVATSSLELGIDMGAVDLVIQIESPPSIAAGVQRIGRAGHHVGIPSAGVIFPKYRGDLLACSAAAERMSVGHVEATYYARNPLDVLAQQMVAMVALEPVTIDELYSTVRCAAPFHELSRSAFEQVLDLLSGRYPSDEFSELRPRVNWDRVNGIVSPRDGTQRIAVVNAGTIPDRGLYGVFLRDGTTNRSRVGELDEEMVFETRPGDVFSLGASTWRVLEITNDQVFVAPAPGEPGRMPFWHGDGPGRPLEFGQAIGQLTRRLMALPRNEAETRLVAQHALDPKAAHNLMSYLHEQAAATGEVPSDQTIVVECFVDEVGDWRVAILTPCGARVHAPWATAVRGRLQEESSGQVDVMWTDDGMMFRLPESAQPPDAAHFFPSADEVRDAVVQRLASTALFAARFRENAARALLLPKRQPGRRRPLWLQRRRAADLLAVASRYPNFPILLETYRECLRDVFDIRGLEKLLRGVQQRTIQVRSVQTQVPSPFSSSLLFNYIGHFMYDGDAPLAERRAAALSLDHAQLRELLGDAELRELLDADAVGEIVSQLQRLDSNCHFRSADGLHQLLLQIGDCSRDELAARCLSPAVTDGSLDRWLRQLTDARRVVAIRVSGHVRFIAAEDAARFRDALGSILPAGLPNAFLESVADALSDLASRYARTRGPFLAEELAARFGLDIAPVRAALRRLAAAGRVLEGEFLPGRQGREWCDAEVLRRLKQRSLAKLRAQIEPVEQGAYAHFLANWQGVSRSRRGLDGLLDVVEQLQGFVVPAATLQRDILPARVADYCPGDLDQLCAAGEVVWRGFGGLGASDGRIALYLTDHYLSLAPPAVPVQGEMAARLRELFDQRGAMFFDEIAQKIGGFRNDVLKVIWQLVWAGELTNDTLNPLSSKRSESTATRGRRHGRSVRFRSRRMNRLPGSEGRWSLLVRTGSELPTVTERHTAIAAQMIERYGVVTRELVSGEAITGGFAGLYPIFKAMEESGRVRRGYFVAGLGAAQFAAPGAEDRLRQEKDNRADGSSQPLILAATDPANPYGTALRWPPCREMALRPARVAGARVIISAGNLLGYWNRGGQQLSTFLRSDVRQAEADRVVLVRALIDAASLDQPVYLTTVDGVSPENSFLGPALADAGFTATPRGCLLRGGIRANG